MHTDNKKQAPKKAARISGFHSLSFTLAGTFFALCFILLLVTGTLDLYFAAYVTQRQSIIDGQQLVLQDAATKVRGYITHKEHVLHMATAFYDLSSADGKAQKHTLDRLLRSEPAFRRATLLDTQGNILQASSRLDGQEPAGQNEIAAITEQAAVGHTYFGDTHIDQATREPQITIAVPVTDEDHVYAGAIAAEVSLRYMWDVVNQIKIGQHGQAFVVDGSGNLIAYHDTARVLARENLSSLKEVGEFMHHGEGHHTTNPSISHGISGTEVVSTHVDLETPEWAVVIEAPISEAYSKVIQNTVSTIAVIIGGACVAAVVSYYVAKRITRPIIALRNTVKKVGAGDLSARTNLRSRNEIGELAAAFDDMTWRLQESGQRLNDEHARLVASIDGLDAGFLMTDRTGKVVLINRAARELFNLPQAAAGAPLPVITDIANPLHKEGVRLPDILAKCQSKRRVINLKEVNFMGKVLQIFVGPILTQSRTGSAGSIGCVVLFEDTTEATVMARSKDEFFSIASHELRTPLTSIRGNSAMMLDMYANALKDKGLREMLTDIHESSLRLIDIVNDFLDVSRIEQGKVRYAFTQVNLQKIIEHVVYEMRAIVMEKNLTLKAKPLTLDAIPLVAGDEDRIKQVIYNLVGNACKFTEPGGTITIDVQMIGAGPGDKVKVSVSDTGHGIPQSAQKLLFRKFQQAGESLLTRDTTRGTGLGLYICKLLVEGMGGTISLDHSQEGVGSTFAFTLHAATDSNLKQLQTRANKGLVGGSASSSSEK